MKWNKKRTFYCQKCQVCSHQCFSWEESSWLLETELALTVLKGSCPCRDSVVACLLHYVDICNRIWTFFFSLLKTLFQSNFSALSTFLRSLMMKEIKARSTNMLYGSVLLLLSKSLFCTLFSIPVTVLLELICSIFFGMALLTVRHVSWKPFCLYCW